MIVQWSVDETGLRKQSFQGIENAADLLERIGNVEGTRFRDMYVNGFRVSEECELAGLEDAIIVVGNDITKEKFRFAIKPVEEFTEIEFNVEGLPNPCTMTINKKLLVGEFLQIIRTRYRNPLLGKILCDGVKLFLTNRVYDCYSDSAKMQILEKKNVDLPSVSGKFETIRFRFSINSSLLYDGVFMDVPVFMNVTCEMVREMLLSYLELYHGIDDVKVDLYFGPGVPFVSGTLNQLLHNRILSFSERIIYVVVYKGGIKANLEHVFDNVVTLSDPMVACLNPLNNLMYRSSMDCMTCALGYLRFGGSRAGDFIRNLIPLIPFPPMITSLYKITREKPTARDILAIAMPLCILIEKCYHVCSDFYSHVFELMNDVSRNPVFPGQVINLRLPGIGPVYLCQGKYKRVRNDEEMFPNEELGGIASAIANLNSSECVILCEGMMFPRPKLQVGDQFFDPYES